MPKTIIVTNAVLLACLSVLASSAVVPLTGGDVHFGRCTAPALSITALVCAVIMLITEVFTGIRWVPIIALASVIAGWAAMDGSEVTRFSQIAWAVGWVSVAAWFGCLAAQARENR